MKVKLSNEKLRQLAMFEELTGVTPRDFVKSGGDDRFTFVVDKGDMGAAIGKKGKNINKVRRKLNKNVDVVKYSDDPTEFLRNIFSPVDIQSVEIDEQNGEKIAKIEVDDFEKGRAVGRNGWNIERARKLSNRHHGLDDISLA